MVSVVTSGLVASWITTKSLEVYLGIIKSNAFFKEIIPLLPA